MKRFTLVVLLLLLISLSASAHLPEPSNPEEYVPILGWIQAVEGDVTVTSLQGQDISLREGSAIRGSSVIDTGSNGRIVLQLEDYTAHASSLIIEDQSRVEFQLGSGKHFDDTISHKWYIDPHAVSIKVEAGTLHLRVITNNQDYAIKQLETANAKVAPPMYLYQHDIIELNLSVARDEEPGELDMSNPMAGFAGQMQQMMEQAGVEDSGEVAEMMELFKDGFQDAQELGFSVDEQGIQTQLTVYGGKATLWADNSMGSSPHIIVGAGETYLVDGVNNPVKVTGEAGIRDQKNPKKSSQFGPTASLNIDLDDRALRPDLATNMKTQTDVLTADSEGAEIPPDMLKTDIWVYQISDQQAKALNNQTWPANTEKRSEQKEITQAIYELVDNFGDSLNRAWGEDWSFRAQMMAEMYRGQTITSTTYSYRVPPFDSHVVNVVSPWIDPKTLEISEGTYVMIMETSVDVSF